MKPWTAIEKQLLHTLCPSMTLVAIAQTLGRPVDSVRFKARSLGIPPRRRNWRAICEAHKPRIVLASPVPMERSR